MTRPLLVIFLTIFVNLIGFGIIIPLLPFYAETFGASRSRSACCSRPFPSASSSRRRYSAICPIGTAGGRC